MSTSARPKRKMSITISIEEPDIILIEDQMNPASNSLLLGVCNKPNKFCWQRMSLVVSSSLFSDFIDYMRHSVGISINQWRSIVNSCDVCNIILWSLAVFYFLQHLFALKFKTIREKSRCWNFSLMFYIMWNYDY